MAILLFRNIIVDIAFIVGLIGFIILASQKSTEESKLLLLIFLSGFLVILGYSIYNSAETEESLIIGTKIQYLGGCFLYPILLSFFAKILNIKLPKTVIYSLLSWSFFIFLLSFTFTEHTFYYKSYYSFFSESSGELIKDYAWGHTLYYITVFAYILSIMVLFAFGISKVSTKLKKFAVIYFLIVVITESTYIISRLFPYSIISLSIFQISLMLGVICMVVLVIAKITDKFNFENEVEVKNRELANEVRLHENRILAMQGKMIYGFASLVEDRNITTGGHIKKTSNYAFAIAFELQQRGKFSDVLTNNYIEKLRQVAPLHDVGKVAIPDAILDKQGKLTDEEYDEIKKHVTIGADILDQTMAGAIDDESLLMAKDLAKYHHEWWNGKGYAAGLCGEQIPLAARIMAVADVFDALFSARPYKAGYSLDDCFSKIEEKSGIQFDPEIVAAFVNIRPQIEAMVKDVTLESFDGIEELEGTDSVETVAELEGTEPAETVAELEGTDSIDELEKL